MTKYGGTRTKVNDIEVGVEFYVHDGNWDGIIDMDNEGNKYMVVLMLDGSLPRYPIASDYARSVAITYKSKPYHRLSKEIGVKLGKYKEFMVNDIVKLVGSDKLYIVTNVYDDTLICKELESLDIYELSKEDCKIHYLSK